MYLQHKETYRLSKISQSTDLSYSVTIWAQYQFWFPENEDIFWHRMHSQHQCDRWSWL